MKTEDFNDKTKVLDTKLAELNKSSNKSLIVFLISTLLLTSIPLLYKQYTSNLTTINAKSSGISKELHINNSPRK